MRLTVLGSGSSGNASLLESNGFGVLLDAGLGPRQIARRLAEVGSSWRHVHAVLLTHTHGDHWKNRTMAYLARQRIPLYCHAEHARALRADCAAFADLQTARLLRHYSVGEELVLSAGLRCRPLAVKHDSGATFGFRFAGAASLFHPAWAIGYVADLGCWDDELVDALADCDLLALEFNHDEIMQRTSGRPWSLIRRVLGDHGHLSNDQAARLLHAVAVRSQPGRLKHVVQLHLSQQCNEPARAIEAARAVIDAIGAAIEVHTAWQHKPTATLRLDVDAIERALPCAV